jgi:hypothetical protein
VDAPKFATPRFAHERTAFPLKGAHLKLECAKCHKTDERVYPAGRGRAVQLKPMAVECRSCHQDQHLGQVDARCETCHGDTTFKLTAYTHRGLADFFAGFHGKLPCIACHKKEAGSFPAGPGTTVRYRVGTTCKACHQNF